MNLTENAAKIVIHDRGRVDPVYLEYALKSDVVQKQIRASTGQVTIGKLALFRIEKLVVPMPNIEDQRSFSCQISKLQGMREKLALDIDMADSLFSSLQHRAFSGQL